MPLRKNKEKKGKKKKVRKKEKRKKKEKRELKGIQKSVERKKKKKLHPLPTVRAEAEPLVRLTTGRPGHLNQRLT